MFKRIFNIKLSSFRIMMIGFLAAILVGTILLMLPVSSFSHEWTSLEDSFFTATSAVCVTGLVTLDTASYWSIFGQIIILILIQIGGLGIISVIIFLASVSGKKISLLQRNLIQESISANQVGGIVRRIRFIFKVAFLTETAGALLLLPPLCKAYGINGIWMAIFHSVSAFCNAGFDLFGSHSGSFSSLTSVAGKPEVLIPISLLIIIGGIGFLTWEDFADHKFHFKKYHMQSKTILIVSAALILIPSIFFYISDFAGYETSERIFLSAFQAITPRTAGFNSFDLNKMTSSGLALIILLMLIGGSPGSTAGGMKTTTLAVWIANASALIHKRKNPILFGRRIEEQAVKSAATILLMYTSATFISAYLISNIENLPFGVCIFETASAIGTVGLTLGITPSLSTVSHLILTILMFLGRMGGLTILYAAADRNEIEISQYPTEKINVG